MTNRVAPKPELKLILARDREQAAAGRLVRARRIAGLALYETFGLVRLTRLGRDEPWAEACGLVREPDADRTRCPKRGLRVRHPGRVIMRNRSASSKSRPSRSGRPAWSQMDPQKARLIAQAMNVLDGYPEDGYPEDYEPEEDYEAMYEAIMAAPKPAA